MKKDTQLRKEVQALGFTIVRANRHIVWHHPTGGVMVTAASIGEGRAYANALARARRIARGGKG